jgi:hypothetical protein
MGISAFPRMVSCVLCLIAPASLNLISEVWKCLR